MLVAQWYAIAALLMINIIEVDLRFHVLVFLCWAIYVVLHSLMASLAFKRMMQRWMGDRFRYYRLLYSCIAAVLLVSLLAFQFSHSSTWVLKRSWPLVMVGIPLTLAGLTVMIMCIKKYFMNLSGVDVLLKEQHPPLLEQSGLHGYVRHPLYSGTLLSIWALFLLFPLLSNLIACAVITVYTLIGIRMEEHKLRLEFGESYRLYAARTPMLIPLLRKSSLSAASTPKPPGN